jgi:hypothetical protein
MDEIARSRIEELRRLKKEDVERLGNLLRVESLSSMEAMKAVRNAKMIFGYDRVTAKCARLIVLDAECIEELMPPLDSSPTVLIVSYDGRRNDLEELRFIIADLRK